MNSNDKVVIFAIRPVKGADRIMTRYEQAASILNDWEILTYATLDPEKAISLAQKYQNVLVITHGILDNVKLALPKAAQYYGGKKVPKPEQYRLFKQHNIPVAPWITNPESWEEVFDKLGDEIIIKPPNRGGGAGIRYVTPETIQKYPLQKIGHYLFCKFIDTGPPYKKFRTNVLFGIIVTPYCYHGINRILTIKNSILEPSINPDILSLGIRTGKLLEHHFKIAMNGVDIIQDKNKNNYVLESNMACPAPWSYEELHVMKTDEKWLSLGISFDQQCLKLAQSVAQKIKSLQE